MALRLISTDNKTKFVVVVFSSFLPTHNIYLFSMMIFIFYFLFSPITRCVDNLVMCHISVQYIQTSYIIATQSFLTVVINYPHSIHTIEPIKNNLNTQYIVEHFEYGISGIDFAHYKVYFWDTWDEFDSIIVLLLLVVRDNRI